MSGAWLVLIAVVIAGLARILRLAFSSKGLRQAKDEEIERILANPEAFREEWMAYYNYEFSRYALVRKNNFTEEDFSIMIDSYLDYLRNGGKQQFEPRYMSDYLQKWKKERKSNK